MKHTVITGHYGSGKTNIAVNLALEAAKKTDKKVYLIDADIVNPYFRSADNENLLAEAGVKLIAPMSANTNLDIPAMPATVMKVFNTDCEVIWDIGGDDSGAVVLGRYSDDIKKQGYEMIYTVNFYRPMTSTEDDMISLLYDIEAASHLKATAIVNNSNLGADTDREIVEASKEKAARLSEITKLPVKFTSVDEKLARDIPECKPIKMVTKKLW
ncbi:MAG: cobalamin biosynthesis protein CobQ [Clostridia bacterium]|nr:cobalamin biosynthesis protein CobQ [Clostridia bacterium]